MSDRNPSTYIGYTYAETWQRCQRRWKYAYLDKLVPLHPNREAMELGTAVHSEVEGAIRAMLATEPMPVLSDIAARAFELVCQHTANLAGADVHLERELGVHNHVSDRTFVAKPDIYAVYQSDDSCLVVDVKTTRAIDESTWYRRLTLDRQLVLYAGAVMHAHNITNAQIAYAVVATEPRAEVKVNKDGMVSAAASSCSRADYQAALDAQGAPPTEQQLVRLAALESKPRELWIMRDVGAGEIQSAMRDLEAVGMAMNAALLSGSFPRSRGSCAYMRCNFEDTCVGDHT